MSELTVGQLASLFGITSLNQEATQKRLMLESAIRAREEVARLLVDVKGLAGFGQQIRIATMEDASNFAKSLSSTFTQAPGIAFVVFVASVRGDGSYAVPPNLDRAQN